MKLFVLPFSPQLWDRSHLGEDEIVLASLHFHLDPSAPKGYQEVKIENSREIRLADGIAYYTSAAQIKHAFES